MSEGGDQGGLPPCGPKQTLLAWGALLVMGLLLGYNWVVMKSALDYAHPAVFAAMRVTLAGVLLFLLLILLRKPLRPPDWRLTLPIGVLGTSAMMGLVFWALKTGGAGKTSVLAYTMPIWLLILSSVFLRERVRGMQWLFVGVALAGLIFVISPWNIKGTLTGNLLAVAAGMCSAISSIFVKLLFRSRKVDLLSLNAWQMLFGCVPLIVIAVLTADSGPQWTGRFALMLGYNVVLASALSLFLWFYTLRHLSAGTAGLGRLLAPVIGVIAAWIQLGERPDGYEITGMVLIMAGVAALAVLQFLSERRTARLASTATEAESAVTCSEVPQA